MLFEDADMPLSEAFPKDSSFNDCAVLIPLIQWHVQKDLGNKQPSNECVEWERGKTFNDVQLSSGDVVYIVTAEQKDQCLKKGLDFSAWEY